MYLDAAYIVKYYLHERDSSEVRGLMASATSLASSALSVAEVLCAFHRRLRENFLTQEMFQRAADLFLHHVDKEFWTLSPMNEAVLRRVRVALRTAPPSIFLRAGDAVHLATAAELGEFEIWTNDRHMLASAPHFGLQGRSA
jgi:predicted nucleic acid-binding protein